MDLATNRREAVLALLIKWFLQARQRVAPSNASQYDEDVNVYLAHLLVSVIEPGYQALSQRYVAARDVDVFEHIAHTDLPQLKSLIYRLNGDHLLLALSIFEPPDPGGATSAGEWHASDRSLHEGYGSTYYHFAATYARQRQPSSLAPSDVMEKLGGSFATYALVLTAVRSDYMHLLTAISSAQFSQFAATLRDQERATALQRCQDAFLDALQRWKTHPSAAHYQRLAAQCDQLRGLDPTFRFTLPPPPTPSAT